MKRERVSKKERESEQEREKEEVFVVSGGR